MALHFISSILPIDEEDTIMSDGQDEQTVDEFNDYIFIRWKMNILYHKVHEFSFRDSKFTLVLQPKICNSILFIFLHEKSSSAAYEVKTHIVDKNGKEVSVKYYKGHLTQRPVIWSIDREKLMSERDIFWSPHVLTFSFKIGTANSVEIQGIPKEGFSSLVFSDPDEFKIMDDKISIEPSLENLSDDICQLYNSLDHSDVIVKSGERKISAHKNILSARSEIFAAMFRNEALENETGVVEITDVKPEVLNQFIQYLYSGKIELCMDSARMLYEAADKYAVDHLKTFCGSYLVKNLEEMNACEILVLADAHLDNYLKESVMRFMAREKDFIQSDQWEKFSEEYPVLAVKVYKMFIEK